MNIYPGYSSTHSICASVFRIDCLCPKTNTDTSFNMDRHSSLARTTIYFYHHSNRMAQARSQQFQELCILLVIWKQKRSSTVQRCALNTIYGICAPVEWSAPINIARSSYSTGFSDNDHLYRTSYLAALVRNVFIRSPTAFAPSCSDCFVYPFVRCVVWRLVETRNGFFRSSVSLLTAYKVRATPPTA